MSRDLQMRVVVCDWLAWLLRMKRPKTDVSLEAVLDTHQSHNHTNDLVTFNNTTEDASSTHHVNHFSYNEVCNFIISYKIILFQGTSVGFFSRHSTCTQLLECVNDWTMAINNLCCFDVAYIYFSKVCVIPN